VSRQRTTDISFNWNREQPGLPAAGEARGGTVFDETLRDGIQATEVITPPLEHKLRIVDHMANCGIASADLGFPGSSEHAANECRRIAEYIVSSKYPIAQGYAARTHPADIAAIREIAQAAGTAVEAYAFIGVSPIRQYVEGWDLAKIAGSIRSAAADCARDSVEFVLVLEDALRCTPEIIAAVYDVAIDAGVRRLTLCDTVGIATPAGTAAILSWSAGYFADRGHAMGLEWHGHNDRGLALANSLTALASGCERVHGTVLGIGERAGNASLDQIIINSYLEGARGYDLKALRGYCEYASRCLGAEIPGNYPAMGSGVFKTSAGVHAAAILKAQQKGELLLKDTVYSSIAASLLGREQEVMIDSSSGASNVKYWSVKAGIEIDDEMIKKVLAAAETSSRPLSDDQVERILAEG
jgi:2-isopropylmalate synthase